MNIREKIGKELLFFDGGMGTMLQKRGLKPGELPEIWNIERKNDITEIHLEYLKSGADIITANTFGANILKFPKGGRYELDTIIKSAIENAKNAVKNFQGDKKHYVAMDIGPLGKLLKPMGDMDFEDAVSIFAESVKIGASCGADLILIETMNDLYETKAAVLAAKENCDLPIFVTNAYDESGNLMTGASPEAVCACLEGLGVDALGMNCSFGPYQMKPILKKLSKICSIPIIVNPNAGIPTLKDGITSYDIDFNQFADIMCEMPDLGAHILGGCCGTTPLHIKAMIAALKDCKITEPEEKNLSVISSYTHAVEFGKKPILIGERINPTGKKLLKEALKTHNIEYILGEGIKQTEAGADVLDVNVGLPEIDEPKMMCEVIQSLQAVVSTPLQIDTGNYEAMEKAMRLYNGKPMINSVNGKLNCMEAIFPLVKKYGGLVVALTLDEKGIPDTSEGRVEIANRIYKKAAEYGISKKDIIVDTLAMTISTDKNAALCTLDAISKISKQGGLTSLGVSNVSFGLPKRDIVNATFYTMALCRGLSAAIINPHSAEMMKAHKSYLALSGLDENCGDFIGFAELVGDTLLTVDNGIVTNKNDAADLKTAIIKGLKDSAYLFAKELLKTQDAIGVINNEIVPALDVVGKGFEEKTVYLPQLLISADSAKAAFDAVSEKLAKTGEQKVKKCTVILATVSGDIHDIGKNIVKSLLENYGFDVIDMGKDVPAEKILEKARSTDAPLVGLSALMTTTVPAMENTIKLLKKELPDIKVMVGGAVLTEEYAKSTGADFYGRDALAAVRFAESIYEK